MQKELEIAFSSLRESDSQTGEIPLNITQSSSNKRLKNAWLVFSRRFETVEDNLSKVNLVELYQYFF